MKDYVETEKPCSVCPESIKRTLATMLDFSILKSCSFVLLALSGFFTMMGLFTPMIYICIRAVINGFDRDSASLLLACMGGANIIGTLLCGVLPSTFSISANTLSYGCLLGAGFATLLSSQNFNDTAQFSYACIYGATIGMWEKLRGEIFM